MQRYNRTNFVSERVARGIVTAMTACLADGFAHYIEDRKGQRWLRVDVVPNLSGQGYTFEFLAGNGQEVGPQIMQAIFSWSKGAERAFSELLSELYTRFEHPLITARRADSDLLDPVNGADAPVVQNKPAKSWAKGLMEHLTVAALGACGGVLYSVARDFLPGVLI